MDKTEEFLFKGTLIRRISLRSGLLCACVLVDLATLLLRSAFGASTAAGGMQLAQTCAETVFERTLVVEASVPAVRPSARPSRQSIRSETKRFYLFVRFSMRHTDYRCSSGKLAHMMSSWVSRCSCIEFAEIGLIKLLRCCWATCKLNLRRWFSFSSYSTFSLALHHSLCFFMIELKPRLRMWLSCSSLLWSRWAAVSWSRNWVWWTACILSCFLATRSAKCSKACLIKPYLSSY